MNVVNLDEIDWFGHVSHREGGIDFKRIFNGGEVSANNFEFNLTEVKDSFQTPRHRHNFDQVRFLVSGEFGFDQGKVQKAGTIGYFPEGTYYTQRAEGPSTTLLLQCANATKSPFMDFGGLRKNVAELEQKGTFKDGIYTYYKDGKKNNVDGHQAIWEHATGQSLKFPKPRYEAPIFMDPSRFEYEALENESGVYLKRMLSVTERQLEIGFLKIEQGATYTFENGHGDYIFYVLEGEGNIGNLQWQKDSAIHLSNHDETVFSASGATEFYYLRLPTKV